MKKDNKKEFVYQFLYNSNIYDGSLATISIHKTRSGAKKAMEQHKKNIQVQFECFRKIISDDCLKEYSESDTLNKIYKSAEEYAKEMTISHNSVEWKIKKSELLN
jgi:hypothetical protein